MEKIPLSPGASVLIALIDVHATGNREKLRCPVDASRQPIFTDESWVRNRRLDQIWMGELDP